MNGSRMLLTFLGCLLAACLAAAPASHAQSAPERCERAASPYPARTELRGNLKISLSEIRTVMRGPMFPSIIRFCDNSIIVSASCAEEGGKTLSIRSCDNGATWRPFESPLTEGRVSEERQQGACAKLQLRDGRAIALGYATESIADKPGWYSTMRWESENSGVAVKGPLSEGRLFLPAEAFDSKSVQWFHGNMIELAGGELLAVMQGRESPEGPFRVYCSKSRDGGVNWDFLAMIASLASIHDPDRRIASGWLKHGPCEPTVVRVRERRLACMMRLINDDAAPLLSPGTDTYRDLAYTVSAQEIYPGMGQTPEKYYTLGAPSLPLLIAYSEDDGATWTKPEPMMQPRGCAPQSARSGSIVALTYGALAYPRWGNCITFSTDEGRHWVDEINFAPFLTTGYTGIVETGPGTFLCVFDAAPPQPWTRHAAHWIGVVDVAVEVLERSEK